MMEEDDRTNTELINNLEGYVDLLSAGYGLFHEQQQRLIEDLQRAIAVIKKT